jgi:hypothetical protein
MCISPEVTGTGYLHRSGATSQGSPPQLYPGMSTTHKQQTISPKHPPSTARGFPSRLPAMTIWCFCSSGRLVLPSLLVAAAAASLSNGKLLLDDKMPRHHIMENYYSMTRCHVITSWETIKNMSHWDSLTIPTYWDSLTIPTY